MSLVRLIVFAVVVAVGGAAVDAVAQTPTLPPNSVVNGASFRPATDPSGAVAPGGIVSIFGTNLASELQPALSVPLSTTLGDTSVAFKFGSTTTTAPLFFVSTGQINAQIPYDVPFGAAVTVQVRRGSNSSSEQPLSVAGVSPGIFTIPPGGTGRGAILHANSADFVGRPTDTPPGRPALPGGFISIFCTGLGALKQPVTSGHVAEGANETSSPALVNIGNTPARVLYAGVAPGFVGLYQVNVEIPNLPAGTHNLQIVINGVASNTVTIEIGTP